MTSSIQSRLGTAPEEGCKAPVKVVANNPITLSGEQTINSVVLVAGDRVLVNGQVDTAENGIYNVSTTAWSYAKDWNKSNDVIAGMLIPSSQTTELYQLKPFTGNYVAGVTEISFQTGVIASKQYERQSGSQAVTNVFTLQGLTYIVEGNDLEVNRNGQVLIKDVHYTETSSTTITILTTVLNTDDFVFKSHEGVTLVSTTTASVSHIQDGTTYNLATYLQNRHVTNIMDLGANPAASPLENTAAIQAALDIGGTVIIPEGEFNFTPPLSINVLGTTLKGLNRYTSILKTDNTASNAIEVGLLSGTAGTKLENFRLTGNVNNGHGVLLGSSTAGRFATSTTLKNLYVESFTNPGFAGLDLRRAWWFDMEKCTFESNYNNIQIRAGSVTTTINIKDNTTIRNALNVGLSVEGTATADVISIDTSTSFEYNLFGAIYSTATKAIFNLDNVYFEQNNGSGGNAVVDITGGSGAIDYTMLNMTNCVSDAPLTGTGLALSNCRKSNIIDCSGWLAQAPTTDSNCDINFRNLNGQSSGDFLATARGLAGKIRAEEYDTFTGRWRTYNSEGNLFEGHLGAVQLTEPTVAVGAAAGTGGTVVLKTGATDSAGQIQITRGASGWLAGTLATVTFDQSYNNAPTVILTPASTGAATQQATLGISNGNVSTTFFTIDTALADSNAGLVYWNYMVIE